MSLLLKTAFAVLVLAQLTNCCFWIFKQSDTTPEQHPIEFTACVFNNSARFDCIQDCVYYAVKHGLEICYCYYRDCANRERNFSFTVTVNANIGHSKAKRRGGYGSHRSAQSSNVFEDGDCRPVYTYDPNSEDNKNDRMWLKVDPYAKSGEICLNGFPAGGTPPAMTSNDDDDFDENDLRPSNH